VIGMFDYRSDCNHRSAILNGKTATFHRTAWEKILIIMIKDSADPQARDYFHVSWVVRKNQGWTKKIPILMFRYLLPLNVGDHHGSVLQDVLVSKLGSLASTRHESVPRACTRIEAPAVTDLDSPDFVVRIVSKKELRFAVVDVRGSDVFLTKSGCRRQDVFVGSSCTYRR
jgi:hypothetical protein